MIGAIVLAVVVAIVFATSLIKNVGMSDKIKNLIAVVLSTIAGVLIDLNAHAFDFSQYAAADIVGTVLTIYGGSQIIYQFILKGTALEAKLEEVALPGVPTPEQPVDPAVEENLDHREGV